MALPVTLLNEFLLKSGLPKKGNKIQKVLKLATEVEARELNKLLEAPPPEKASSSAASSLEPLLGKKSAEQDKKGKKDKKDKKEKKDKKGKKERKTRRIRRAANNPKRRSVGPR